MSKVGAISGRLLFGRAFIPLFRNKMHQHIVCCCFTSRARSVLDVLWYVCFISATQPCLRFVPWQQWKISPYFMWYSGELNMHRVFSFLPLGKSLFIVFSSILFRSEKKRPCKHSRAKTFLLSQTLSLPIIFVFL